MKKNILEICVDSVESALAAQRGGADRLELCSNLVIGGTTPSRFLFEEIRKVSDIKIHALIRPRFGDFCYSDYDFSMIESEVRQFRELGAEGVVIGMLNPDGSLDMKRMEGLMRAADGMSVTLHRAFDVCADPFAALEQAMELGIDTILTSGQQNTAFDGMDLLKQLVHKGKGKIDIMAGSGVDAGVIEEIAAGTGITSFHMSGKVTKDSKMTYRKEGVSMGLPAFSEYEIWETSEEKVRKAKQLLILISQH